MMNAINILAERAALLPANQSGDMTVFSNCQMTTTDNIGGFSGNGLVGDTYTWWPVSWPYPVFHEDKLARAFRIVKVLVDQKVVALDTPQEFIDLVEALQSVV